MSNGKRLTNICFGKIMNTNCVTCIVQYLSGSRVRHLVNAERIFFSKVFFGKICIHWSVCMHRWPDSAASVSV